MGAVHTEPYVKALGAVTGNQAVQMVQAGLQAIYLDLSNTSVLSSEYYYLLPNDVVYVPTLKARVGRLNMDVFVVLLSAISTAAVIFTIVQNTQ